MDNTSLTPPQYNISSHVRRASYSKASSASCANAKPSEDWTQMTDLVERRRVQNRIAQRNYRQKLKKRLERAGEYERRAVSTSPPSTNALLLSSPETRDRSLSTGASINTHFVPQPQMSMYQELFPEQYASVHDSQFPAVTEGYLKQPMTPTPSPFSFPGYSQPVPAAYSPFPQNTAYADMPSISVPYAGSMNQGHYAVDGSPMTTTSGPPFTPVTPTSHGDCYPTNEGPLYGIDFAHTYDNPQLPATQAYPRSNASVTPSDFFRQN